VAQSLKLTTALMEEGGAKMTRKTAIRIVAVVTIIAVTTILLKGTLGKGYPDQFENYGSYMSNVKFLETNGFTWFTQNWYFGFEIGRYYPPLTTFITYVIGQIIGDSSLAFNLIAFAAYLLLGLSLYAFLVGEFKNQWSALVAALLFITAYTTILSNQGFYWQVPRTSGFSLIPVLLILIRKGFEKRSFKIAIGAGVVLSIILLFNILAFTEAVMICALYLGLRLIQKISLGEKGGTWVDKKQLVLFGLAFLAISGWWLIPAVLPYGLSSFVQSTAEYPLKYLIDLNGSVPSYTYYLVSILSLPGILAIAGIVSVLRRRTTVGVFALTLLVVSIILVVLQVAQGSRYIFDGALALAIISGVLIDQLFYLNWPWAKLLTGVVIFAVIVSASLTAFSEGLEIRVDENAFREGIEYQVDSRVATLMQKNDVVYIAYDQGFHGGTFSFNLFFPEKAQVRGAFKAGNHNSDSSEIDKLVNSGSYPKRLDALLQKYGVTYLVVNQPKMEQAGTFSKLHRYKIVDQYEYMTILYTGYSIERPASPYIFLNGWRIFGLLVSLGACLATCGIAQITLASPKRNS